MRTKKYLEQYRVWPDRGRHILAQFDADTICVYQAYRPSIAEYAVNHQRFGGDFSYNRMSWIKPTFLWMMHRSGWASKKGQEHILAITLPRSFFDELLRSAIPSSYDPRRFSTVESWQHAVISSEVRMQWDPDHDPAGRPLQRRAIQLGLRGETLRRYGEREALSIADVTDFVVAQRAHLEGDLGSLVIPEEQIYEPETIASQRAGIDRLANDPLTAPAGMI
ncbi:MAG TPA: DUF4291 domain-containing protein [Dyella sp.]|uniref:DUF4291 domain-containing protein n=1 Tax=Dyella sp. TaxID=1869338 RepID=UPI002F92B87D